MPSCKKLAQHTALLLLLLLVLPQACWAAQPVIGFRPPTATPAEVQRAERLEPLLTGLSAQEPALCQDIFEATSVGQAGGSNDGSIVVSPASTEMTGLQPGRSYAYCLSVHNRSDKRHDFQISTIDITGSPDPAQQQAVIDPPSALGAWVRPVRTNFRLAGGERIIIPYVLELPADLPKGTLTAGIRVTQLPDPDAPPAGAAIQPSVNQRLHLTVPGGTAEKLVVSKVRAPRYLSHDDAPLAYRAKFVVTNTGTVLDAYIVDLDVYGLGRRVGGGKVDTATVLPNGANNVVVVWRGLPWIGWYRPEVKVKSRAGDVTVRLPRLLILPSRPYVIAFAVAILLPLIAFILRWRRRRAEWLLYLDEEDQDEEIDGEAYDEDQYTYPG